jgi:uncharacterized protein YkwD
MTFLTGIWEHQKNIRSLKIKLNATEITSDLFLKSVECFMQNLNLNRRSARALLLLSAGIVLATGLTLPQISQASTTIGAPSTTAPKARRSRRAKVPKATPAPQTITAADSLEVSAHNQINQYRASKGLPALAWNEALAAQARQHSVSMANGQTAFGHDGFNGRIKGSGVTAQGAAENVAYNQGYSDPVGAAVKGWLESPGHLQNIEGNYDTAGLGVARNAQGEIYFTQVFVRSR